MKQDKIKPKTNEPTPGRRIGKMCDKHPELNGLRYVKSYTCIGCQRIFRLNSGKTPQAKARRLEKQRTKRNAKELNEEFKRLIWIRAEKLCIEAGHNPFVLESMKGRFWHEARRQLNEEHKAKTGMTATEMLGLDDDDETLEPHSEDSGPL